MYERTTIKTDTSILQLLQQGHKIVFFDRYYLEGVPNDSTEHGTIAVGREESPATIYKRMTEEGLQDSINRLNDLRVEDSDQYPEEASLDVFTQNKVFRYYDNDGKIYIVRMADGAQKCLGPYRHNPMYDKYGRAFYPRTPEYYEAARDYYQNRAPEYYLGQEHFGMDL